MTDRDHVADAKATIDRIGAVCDALGAAGWGEIQAAVAAYTRERRGVLKRTDLPLDAARDLINLADEAERLLATLDADPLPDRLDRMEAQAAAAVVATYGPMLDDTARGWVQKGIEGMRTAVALSESVERPELPPSGEAEPSDEPGVLAGRDTPEGGEPR